MSYYQAMSSVTLPHTFDGILLNFKQFALVITTFLIVITSFEASS